MKTKTSLLPLLAALCAFTANASRLHAAELQASGGAAGDDFGISVSQSGSIGLVGASRATIGANTTQGAAYVYRSLDTATSTVAQNVKLTASDGTAGADFGNSVSQSGSIGLVGAYQATIGANSFQGAAYVFRNLDTATGAVTQNVKLTSSDGASSDSFGNSVSQSGSIGLVGANLAKIGANSFQGAAYVFRNLDTATGTVTQDVKLTSSDGAAFDQFGSSVSQSGSIGLVGTVNGKIGANFGQGTAYVFRNLDTATGTVTQNVKLTASDGASGDAFGLSVSQSGSIGLVGAYRAVIGANTTQGAAYVFRNLDTATGIVTQNVKLTASDGAAFDQFGYSVSLAGSTGLVGATNDTIGGNASQGSAYVFRNLDTAMGTVTQNVKLTASDGASNNYFGYSVGLNGDQFIIGAFGVANDIGKAYAGSVSSMTTLNDGNISRSIDGVSFNSQDDWIIGQSTDANQVTLNASNAATVTATGKVVSIGQNAGSDHNTLAIGGAITAHDIYIGSLSGNEGNTLRLDSTADFTIDNIYLASGNLLSIEGDYTAASDLLTYLGSTDFQIWDGSMWETVDGTNYTGLITSNFGSGYTTIETVPEPSTWALLGLSGSFFLLAGRRRFFKTKLPT